MRYDKAALEGALKTKKLGRPLYFYPETDSTNDRIRELALEGAAEGTLAVAEMQKAGRGRRGRAWQAPAGSGIWMSLLLRPNILPEKASTLTLLAGMAVAEAVRDMTGLGAEIKWPNDILLNGKKLVGILTEMDCSEEEIHFVTLGIGINVNTRAFPEEMANIATSLYLESGRQFDRAELMGRIVARFEELYEDFVKRGGDFWPFRQRYRENCLNIGRKAWVIAQEMIPVTALDITLNGELLVRRADTGAEEVISSGEVSLRGEDWNNGKKGTGGSQ